MADIDMDLDAPLALGMEGQVDVDLIDYDDDDIQDAGSMSHDQNGPPIAGKHDILDQDEDMYMHIESATDISVSQAPKAGRSNQTNDEVFTQNQETIENDTSMSPSHVIDFQPEASTSAHSTEGSTHDNIDFTNSEQKSGQVEEGLTSGANADKHDDVNEIDYEDDEPDSALEHAPDHDNEASYGDQSVQELYERNSQGLSPQNAGDTLTDKVDLEDESILAETQIQERSFHSSQGQAQSNVDAVEPDHAEDEITWEENDLQAEDPGGNDHTSGEILAREVVSEEESKQEQASHLGTHDIERKEDGASQEDFSFEATGDNEVDGTEEVRDESGKEDEPSIADHASLDNGGDQYPAITVQYKGDEFPFFSLTSEGFFSEHSVLDDSLEKVLGGFRAELINEISEEEELVFQIDELGLEFSESHPRDSVSSITLRQILDIFDLLVKNQDPDNSRTLYTYLFTKPSTTKRFESLVESAAAGRGLDEVIHLFESPMPQGHINADTTKDGNDNEFEDYESTAELVHEETDHDPDEQVHNHDLIGLFDDHDDAAALGLEQSYDNDSHQQPTEQAVEVAETVIPSGVDGIDNHADEVDLTTDFPNHDVGAEVGEVVDGDNANKSMAENSTAVDYTGQTLAEATVVPSSASSTINNDAQALDDDEVDFSAGGFTDDPAHVPEAAEEDDALAEIDWREDPTAEEAVPTPPSATKRARPDDEVDADEEQDTKRLRS